MLNLGLLTAIGGSRFYSERMQSQKWYQNFQG